jgi:nitrite reductase (NO-forming)/hydroxylamine reductase
MPVSPPYVLWSQIRDIRPQNIFRKPVKLIQKLCAQKVILLSALLIAASANAENHNPAELYLKNCSACHQADGQGLPGAFPPLSGSDYIEKDPWILVEATVAGLSGPLTVNGVEYNNVMPAMSYLSDDELATILTYVLNSWGNPGGKFDAEQISIYRKAAGLEARQGAGERHPGSPEAEVVYQSQPMVMGGADQIITPGAPVVSRAEFETAQQLYFERCAGCHGVLRKGATGKPLTPDLTQEKGTEYLKALINFGSAGGMPNWGTSGELTDEQIDILARYLQHDGRLHAHPLFGNMPRETWDRVHCVHCAHHLSFVIPSVSQHADS